MKKLILFLLLFTVSINAQEKVKVTRNAGKVGNKTVNEANIGDGKIIAYDSTNDWMEYTTAGIGDVTAAATITDHSIVRGDGGAKGVQESGVIIDDSDNVTGMVDLTITGDYSASNGVYNNAWSPPPGGVILNGVDQYYSIDNGIVFGTGDFSASAYLLIDSYNNKYIFGGQGGSFSLNVSTTGYLQVYKNNITALDASTLQLELNTVYMVSYTRTSGIGKYYVNGNFTNAITDNSDYTGITETIGVFRASSPNSFFDGTIWGAKLHNHALTQAEVTQAWNNGEPHLATTEFKHQGASQDQIVINGDMVSATGWNGANWVVSGNVATATSTVDGLNRSDTPFIIGKSYLVEYKINSISSGGLFFRLGVDEFMGTTNTIAGTYTENFIYQGTGIDAARVELRPSASCTAEVEYLEVVQIGEVLNIPFDRFGTNGAIDISGNELHANSSGSPIAVMGDWDVRTLVSTTEVELVNTQKKGYRLIGIDTFDKSGSANTFYIGTATGVYDIAPGTSVSANSNKYTSINQTAQAERSLFVKAGASSVTFILDYIKVQ